MRVLYNKNKWLDIFNSKKYQEIREQISKSFTGLTFIEEGHKYFLNNKEMTCVSNVAHLFQTHIDTDKLATETYLRNFNNEKSKYYQMTKEDILNSWKKISEDSCSHGTSTHEFGESCFYYMTGQYDMILPAFKDRLTEDGGFKAILPKEESIVKFYEEIPRCIVPILAEAKVFVEYEKEGYAGTFDILFYYDAELDGKPSKNNGLVVMDWKGLDINTPIFTKNNGWKTMGTIECGDIVFDKNGEETKVLHTSSIHNKKCYKIKFDNNVEIIADYDHRWEITYKSFNKNKIDILTTEELFDYCNKIKNRRISGNIPCVNISKPLKSTCNCDIDPYILGVWLGDGHSSCGMITNMYDEIFDEIEKRGFKIGQDVSQGGAGKAKTKTVYGLHNILNKYNLLNNKHIPNEVLLSDFEYKKQVLHGLMDSDGYYNKKRKRCVFSTSRIKQVEFTVQLLSSMGIKCTVLKMFKKCNEKKIQCYDITFTCDFNPFLIRNINIEQPTTDYSSKSNIISVEECESVPTRCIEVDSPTHTFLYGNQFMVTHNTNKDLYKNFKEQKLLPPFEGLLDMPLSVYKLQLSLYENALHKIGLKVIARRILWLKPDGSYEKINLESYREIIDDSLKKLYN